MSNKTFVYIGATVGSIIGSVIPNLWGAGFLSLSSVFLGAVGGIIGIYIALKFLN